MPTGTGRGGSKNGRGAAKKRELAADVRSTKFWAQDDVVFVLEMQRTGATPADLLRDIVHGWAKKMRLSGHVEDDTESTVRKAHEKIVAEQVAPLRETVAQILSEVKALSPAALSPNGNTPVVAEAQGASVHVVLARLLEELSAARKDISQVAQNVVTASTAQGEQLSLSEVLLQRLLASSNANYMLSGQSFTAVWAALDFLQRYLAEPALKALPGATDDPYQTASTQLEDARKEGLEMVSKMAEVFQFPGKFELFLIAPPEDQ